MKSLLIILCALGLAAAGCGRETTSPEPQRQSWDALRFQQAAGGPEMSAIDLSVLPVGALTLRDDRGNVASSRGLLAGGKLETLTRLVDALPPLSYVPAGSCESAPWSITLTRDGEELTYASCDDDAAAPEGVRAAGEFLDDLVDAVLADADPQKPVRWRTLAAGATSAVHVPRRVVLRDMDALLRVLRDHSPGQPTVVPRVDFAREMVVAEFLGDREAGSSIESAGAVFTRAGVLRMQFEVHVPSAACGAEAAGAQPFVLVAVDRHGDAIVFSTATQEVVCE